ncbi:MAG TPA: cysteine desulfurase family protein [Candidatus Nanoarchaeia archaeon]|nr:cysteine desulfurase family protein [Candidatus Nanoarchaeia archaeon]
MKIYLDNAATTQVAKEVFNSMKPYLTEKYGNASSLHSFGEEANKALTNSRKIIAEKLKANQEEIIFTSGGTESNNLAILGIAHNYREKGNHIITTKFEHPSVLETCKALEKEGFNITYLNLNREGFINLNELKNSINSKTILVSIMHANNEIGTVQDLKEIYKICKSKNAIFHTDAVQSFCKADLNSEMADLISISSHKIHGPKGIGALYVKKGIMLKKLLHGGKHEFNLRPGTENIPSAVGFAKATALITNKDIERMSGLRNKLISEILKIKDTWLNGSKKRLCNNVNISFKYIEGESILMYLNEKGIAVSTGSACAAKELKPSHVLLAIGLKQEDAHGSIRFTLSRYTTEKEIDYVIKVLPGIVKQLREMSPFKGE